MLNQLIIKPPEKMRPTVLQGNCAVVTIGKLTTAIVVVTALPNDLSLLFTLAPQDTTIKKLFVAACFLMFVPQYQNIPAVVHCVVGSMATDRTQNVFFAAFCR